MWFTHIYTSCPYLGAFKKAFLIFSISFYRYIYIEYLCPFTVSSTDQSKVLGQNYYPPTAYSPNPNFLSFCGSTHCIINVFIIITLL